MLTSIVVSIGDNNNVAVVEGNEMLAENVSKSITHAINSLSSSIDLQCADANVRSQGLMSTGARISIFTIYATIFVLGLLGNSVVIFAVCRNRQMRGVTNMYIVNLALADIFLAISAVPFTPVYLILDQQWIFGDLGCKTIASAQVLSAYVSSFTLALISTHRYSVVMHPLERRSIANRCKLLNAVVWILAICLSSPYIDAMRVKPENCPQKYCIEDWQDERHRLYFGISSAIVQFLIPGCIIAYCYVRVYVKLRSRQFKRSSLLSATSNCLTNSNLNSSNMSQISNSNPNLTTNRNIKANSIKLLTKKPSKIVSIHNSSFKTNKQLNQQQPTQLTTATVIPVNLTSASTSCCGDDNEFQRRITEVQVDDEESLGTQLVELGAELELKKAVESAAAELHELVKDAVTNSLQVKATTNETFKCKQQTTTSTTTELSDTDLQLGLELAALSEQLSRDFSIADPLCDEATAAIVAVAAPQTLTKTLGDAELNELAANAGLSTPLTVSTATATTSTTACQQQPLVRSQSVADLSSTNRVNGGTNNVGTSVAIASVSEGIPLAIIVASSENQSNKQEVRTENERDNIQNLHKSSRKSSLKAIARFQNWRKKGCNTVGSLRPALKLTDTSNTQVRSNQRLTGIVVSTNANSKQQQRRQRQQTVARRIVFLQSAKWQRDRLVRNISTLNALRDEQRDRRLRKTNNMLILMVILFNVSWLPLSLHNLITDFNPSIIPDEILKVPIFMVVHSFACCSVIYNPILYAFMSDNFRLEFKQIFKSFCKNNDNKQSSSTMNEVHTSKKMTDANTIIKNHKVVIKLPEKSTTNNEEEEQQQQITNDN